MRAYVYTERDLALIEAQFDGTEPYYTKHLIAGLREAWQRIGLLEETKRELIARGVELVREKAAR